MQSKLALEVQLRKATADDRALLFALYVADREGAFASLPLCAVQKRAMLEAQLRARDAEYAVRFPQAEQCIVVAGHESVGQVLLLDGPETVRILEFSVAPEHRRRGVGEGAVRLVQERAAHLGRTVRLRVRAESDALRLYVRLGFAELSRDERYVQMIWTAGPIRCS